MSRTSEEEVMLGFGANLGNPGRNIVTAFEMLEKKGVAIIKKSSFYKTSPMGNPDQPDFINAAALGVTEHSPHALLKICKEIELSLGRDADQPRWSARSIDIDILLYGGHAVETPDLIIPHPRMADRLFAMSPAVEIAPDFVMPGGASLRDFFDARRAQFDFSGQTVEKLLL